MKIAGGIGGNKTISPKVKMWIPGQDGTGSALDGSGNGNHLAPEAGNNTQWGTAGFVSAKATAAPTDGALNAGLTNPINTWDSATEYLLIAMQIKAPVHPAASRIFGTSSGNSTGAGFKGIGMGSNANLARLGPRLCDGTTNLGANDWAVDTLDNNLHSIIWFLDGYAKQYWAWIDGALLSNGVDFSSFTQGCAQTTEPLRVGRIGSPAAVNTRATGIRNLLVAKGTGLLPANYLQLVAAYLENPFRPWNSGMLA